MMKFKLKPEDILFEASSVGLFGSHSRIKMMHLPSKCFIDKTYHYKIDRALERQIMLDDLTKIVQEHYKNIDT